MQGDQRHLRERMPPVDLVAVREEPGESAEQIEKRHFGVDQESRDCIDLGLAQLTLIRRNILLDRNEVSQSLERPGEGDRLDHDGEATRFERGQKVRDELHIDMVEDSMAEEDVERIPLERRGHDVADDELDAVADSVELGASLRA